MAVIKHKYKVGQKVRVKKNLECIRYDTVAFAKSMNHTRGMCYEVKKTYYINVIPCYILSPESGGYTFTEGMLEKEFKSYKIC